MKKIINLTPHDITFVGTVNRTIPASGIMARVTPTRTQIGSVDGIPVNKTSFGKITDLPEKTEDTVFIVSSLVAQACPERDDIFIVDDTVRNDKGRIIGCRALAHI